MLKTAALGLIMLVVLGAGCGDEPLAPGAPRCCTAQSDCDEGWLCALTPDAGLAMACVIIK